MLTSTTLAKRRASDMRIPTIDERDHLLYVVHGHDQRPPACVEHTKTQANRSSCADCLAVDRWTHRMGGRFRRQGMRLILADHLVRAYGDNDPEPQCPEGHPRRDQYVKICKACRARKAWLGRQRRRKRRTGNDVVHTDWEGLVAHVRNLHEVGGLPYREIARAANVNHGCVARLMNPGTGTAKGRTSVSVANRLLAIPVPQLRFRIVLGARSYQRRNVESTGTRRRMRAACWRGHSLSAQARRIGYAPETAYQWIAGDVVPLDVAEAIADIYPDLIANPGDSRIAIGMARQRKFHPPRLYGPDNIDDPAFEPLRRITATCGIWRRQRALAWMGYGPAELAAFFDDNPDNVERWIYGRSAPAYALHLMRDAFDKLSGTRGPNAEIAQVARENRWDPPLAWYDIDIDDARSRACVDLPSTDSRNRYPLDSQIWWAVAGLVPAAELLHTEKARAVHILHAAGLTDREIAVRLHWNEAGDADKGMSAVCAFRIRIAEEATIDTDIQIAVAA